MPIIADCDSGYGDAANVFHMTRKFEAAGVAAVCIEDKEFPKTNSFIEGRQNLASIESFAEKIQAAVRGRATEMMIFARIEALVSNHGLDEALRRAHAYADAQADVILIHSQSRTPDEVLECARRWPHRAPARPATAPAPPPPPRPQHRARRAARPPAAGRTALLLQSSRPPIMGLLR